MQVVVSCRSSDYWQGQMYIRRAAATDHFHYWSLSQFTDLCAEWQSKAKCNSRTKRNSIHYHIWQRKAANTYIWECGTREYLVFLLEKTITEMIGWLLKQMTIQLVLVDLLFLFLANEIGCFNTATGLKLWYFKNKLIMCVFTVAFPWGTSALYEAASLLEDDRPRSVERKPWGLGSSPWKSQSNDPLRGRYIIQQADCYNPLNLILGRNSDTNENQPCNLCFPLRVNETHSCFSLHAVVRVS